MDLARLKPQDFSDEDLDLPYYLVHLHTIANAIDSSGPTRGYIRYPLAYPEDDTDNPRVMENVLALAWFYTASRSWNPYRGHPALRARLEAALEHWSKSEREHGPFSKRPAHGWRLAGTAFATKFFGETLILLRGGPKITSRVYARALETQRRAVEATLTIPEFYSHGKSYTNQFTNVWGGGLALFSLVKEDELERRWKTRFTDSIADFQSPAGYYYEKDGPDIGYTKGTHTSNVRQAWAWLRGTPLGDELLARERKWFDWLAMNALPEPGNEGFIIHRAIGTRQLDAGFHAYTTPLGEYAPLARAFAESREELAARRSRERAELVAQWPKVRSLQPGDRRSFSPYTFLFRRLNEWRPSSAEKKAARRLLPTLGRQRFTQQRRDSRKDIAYSFVQRPRYYAAFTTGEKVSPRQRYGLGLLWNSKLGTVLQSQSNSDDAAWGTQAAGAPRVYEGESLTTTFALARKPLASVPPGVTELGRGDLEARYPLGKAGEKTLRFLDWKINVSVRHAGDFTETLPLLAEKDGELVLAPGRATLKSARGSLSIRFSRTAKASFVESDSRVLSKRLVVLTLRAKDELDYSLECIPR